MNEEPGANAVGAIEGGAVAEDLGGLSAAALKNEEGPTSSAGTPLRPRRPPSLAPFARGSAALKVRIKGRRRNPRDVYHWLLTTPWLVFISLGLGAYLLLNTAFALLYFIDPGGLTGARAGSFADTFFFSVETIGTIGYGLIAPKDLYTNIVMTAENFCGLSFIAVATGVIFARVSRPTARVVFTRNALITMHESKPTFMFRAANERANRLLEADVTVSMTRDLVTAEGKSMRRFEDMKVVRARSPLFALTWTVLHVIDKDSPLFGLTEEGIREEAGQILVSISGMDETFAQRIHARHAYGPTDLVWNRHFADVIFEEPAGQWVLDFARFHDLDDIAEREDQAEADLAGAAASP